MGFLSLICGPKLTFGFVDTPRTENQYVIRT
jgi:hypothetical protein